MRETVTQIMASVPDAVSHKRIANNTVQYTRANGDTVWRLHQTDVVTKHVDGSWTLNSGGWKTPTTKDRINKFAPCNVYSGHGVWLVGHDGGEVPFIDGIKLSTDGSPIVTQDVLDAPRHANAMKRKITKFCKLIDSRKELPYPDSGDCWICSMFHPESANRGKRHLEFNHVPNTGPNHAPDCLESHLDEGYLHGSFLVNAMRWAGYSDEGIGIYYSMANARYRERGAFKRAVRRYLKAKLQIV